MKKIIALALLLSGCALHYCRTHTCQQNCSRMVGPESRDLMPGSPVNYGSCLCSDPRNPRHFLIVTWKP